MNNFMTITGATSAVSAGSAPRSIFAAMLPPTPANGPYFAPHLARKRALESKSC